MDLPNQPLVVDAGASAVRAGFAGEAAPGIVFPAYTGCVKHERVMLGAPTPSEFVGAEALENRGLLRLTHPITHGVVRNWADMELLFHHMYTPRKHDVKGIESEDHPVLLTEAPLNVRKNRERMAELFFETFNVPALYFAVPAVLSLYASGKTNGLALDVGDSVAYCVPVYKGFAISNAIMRSDLGGADVTDFLQLLLRKIGVSLLTTAEREVVKEIKDAHSFLASSAEPSAGASVSYKLPDGQKIEIGHTELARAPEILFRPLVAGSEERGVAELVSDAISRSDLDLRSTFYQSILLSGGFTETRNFGDRLLNELKASSPPATKLRIFAPPDRVNSAWTGGSFLGGLSTFKKMWVSAEDWAENPGRIHQ